MDEAPAELPNNAAEMEMSRLSVLLAGVGEQQQQQKNPKRSDRFCARSDLLTTQARVTLMKASW